MNLYKISDARTKLYYGDAKGPNKLTTLKTFLTNAGLPCIVFNGRLSFTAEANNLKFPNGQDSFVVELIETIE